MDSLDEIEMLKELQSIRKECPQYEKYYKENVVLVEAIYEEKVTGTLEIRQIFKYRFIRILIS